MGGRGYCYISVTHVFYINFRNLSYTVYNIYTLEQMKLISNIICLVPLLCYKIIYCSYN